MNVCHNEIQDTRLDGPVIAFMFLCMSLCDASVTKMLGQLSSFVSLQDHEHVIITV